MRSGNVDFALVLSMFFDTRLGGRSLFMSHVGAVLGLSWEDLGPLGPPWGHLVPRWGNLGRTWRLLGSTWGDIANAK